MNLKGTFDRSGSTALAIFIIDDMCYIANVGDSRAVLSSNHGQLIEALSKDHKPHEREEYERITWAGGKVY